MTPAVWAWIILVVLINVYWTVYDFVLANRIGWRTMTNQFQAWLHEPVMGPLIFGLTAMVVAMFLYHMLVRASS